MKSTLFPRLLVYLFAIWAASTTAADNGGASWARQCTGWDDWDKPGPPFRLFGNAYYVGTCGISAILIAGSEGHILIDGGTAAGASVIAANIDKLGFRLSDIQLLLHSHEHFDHVGGLAELQKASGAKVMASALAAPRRKIDKRTSRNSASIPKIRAVAPNRWTLRME